MSDPTREWERWGEIDPYFAVLTDERFRKNALTAEALHEFWRSGEDRVAHILERIRNRISPGFSPISVVDFGCGVGRIVLPLAKRFRNVYGVDVSKPMLAECGRNLTTQGLTNVTLLQKVDELPLDIDLIHSTLTFQHIRPQVGMKIAEVLIKKMSSRGIGIFHFLVGDSSSSARRAGMWLKTRVKPLHIVHSIISRKTYSDPLMEMNIYKIHDIARMILADGRSAVFSEFFSDGRLLHAEVFVYKR
jgi:SAM-dependent methyltransferase